MGFALAAAILVGAAPTSAAPAAVPEVTRGAPNGCGSQEPGSTKFPDGFPGLYSFLEACNNHDVCYENAGTSKDLCDFRVLGDLAKACQRGSHSFLFPVNALCFVQSLAYWAAVSVAGDDSYASGQRAATSTTVRRPTTTVRPDDGTAMSDYIRKCTELAVGTNPRISGSAATRACFDDWTRNRPRGVRGSYG